MDLNFDPAHFDAFTRSLAISSKEEGVILLGEHLLGTQRMLMREMQIGMQEGVREFVTLKCRQIGVSTISLALDLYWPLRYTGLNGALVMHDDPARDQFRSTIEMYIKGLPDEWKVPVVQHNRNQLVFQNGSRFQYKVAGIKEKSAKALGRSSALTFLHATEVAFWGDPNQMAGLKSTLAEKNPVRLYHWETTANGFNHFYDMWNDAKKSVTQRAIFISFWANEYYRFSRDSEVFRIYWGPHGRPSKRELEWIREVKLLYDVTIEPEQLAWYRWMAAEKVTDENDLMQEFPPTEHHAFVATGSAFFTADSINEAYKRILKEPKPDLYRVDIGKEFTDTQLIPMTKEQRANFKVWAQPEKDAMYVVGADPAFGSSERAANFCAQVFRCWSNRLEQVAEFTAGDIETHSFAWVIVYLCGAYQPCILNLEVNGAGQTTLKEIQNLKRDANLMARQSPAHSQIMKDVMGSMRQYMYRRLDAISGMPTALHTQTNLLVKERMLGDLKSYFSRGIFVPHSRELIDEMKSVTRDGGAAPAASGNAYDDRVMASGLGCLAWSDQMRAMLINKRMVWAPEEKRIEVSNSTTPVLGRNVQSYLREIGVLRNDEVRKKMTAVPKN